jgi:hypothetical protein
MACGCANKGGGGGGVWASSRTRWMVVLPSGGTVTFGNQSDAVRHAELHHGTVKEIRPGVKLR